MIVLSKQSDSFGLQTVEIDGNSYTIPDSWGADLDYNWGPTQNGCSFVIIYFNGTDYTDHTSTYDGSIQ